MDFTDKAIGRYQVKKVIGSGAMADVYEAYDPEIDRIGAIKILKDSLLQETEYLSRFLKEAKAAGTLTHPNIVTIFDIGKVNDLPFILMELLKGETLADLLRKSKRLPYETTIEIAMQVASALDYAHSLGVVHRDIKPDNIIYDANKKVAKIADFGIAKRLDADAADSTQAGVIMGTPRYMSPEQARGDRIDGRADLFSLGVILYEMVTGKKAFDAKSMPTLIMQIIQKEPESIKISTPDIPAGLQGIITRLMQKKPGKRFQSGKQAYDALAKELRTLQDQQDDESYLPMQVRWTAAMGLMVGTVMLVSSILVNNVQSKLLNEQAINNGISLATFVAAETALPLLGEDWIGLEALTTEAYKRKSFDYLSITDHEGIVRASTDDTLSKDAWELVATREGISIYDVLLGDQQMFIFDAPVEFNNTTIGRINVGIGQAQLDEVMYQTRRIMGILALSVVLAVLLIFYFFNRLIETNLLVIRRAIAELKDGNFSVRISRKWKREFGSLANNINILAETLQHQSFESPQTSEPATADKTSDETDHTDESTTVQNDDDTGGESSENSATDSSGDFAEFTVVQSSTDDL